MVALPGQLSTARLFRSASSSSRKTITPTPNAASATAGQQTLLIDALKLGTLIDRVPFYISNN
jgi:hypothetical protein